MGASPPQFNPPRQQSSNKIWLWLLLAFGVFCVICAIGGYFMFRSGLQAVMGTGSCMMNGSLAQNALLAYSMAHDGELPKAETWQDDVRPYYEKLYNEFMTKSDATDMPDFFNFKVAGPGMPLECDLGGGKMSSFAYNDAVAGKKVADIAEPTKTLLVFELPGAKYNAHSDPATRNPKDPILTFFGKPRDWMDFMVDGQSDPFKSNDPEFNIDLNPEDGLSPEEKARLDKQANPKGA